MEKKFGVEYTNEDGCSFIEVHDTLREAQEFANVLERKGMTPRLVLLEGYFINYKETKKQMRNMGFARNYMWN